MHPMPWARTVHGAAAAVPVPTKFQAASKGSWPPVPDLFDVITYFRARGDSYTLIASIGFWVGEEPSKALTAPRVEALVRSRRTNPPIYAIVARCNQFQMSAKT